MTHLSRWSRTLLLCGAAACSRSPAPVSAPLPSAPIVLPAPAPAPVVASPPTMQEFVDSLVALPQFANANWGILIVGPDRGDTLARVNADKLVMPASNQKIVTGSVSLSQLGPDYVWRTTVTRSGPVVRGELRGDLVITGTGDPSVSTAMRGADPLVAFDPVITALKAAGVKRIRGIVRAGVPAFPGSPHGYGWDWDDLDAAYGAGISDLLFNEGFSEFSVTGCGAPGRPACVRSAPALRAPAIRSQVTTRAAGSGRPSLEWWRDSAAVPGIVIRGSIAAGDSMRFEAAHPSARLTYIGALTEALTRAGILVGSRTVSGTASDTVVVLKSPPLRDVLPVMEKPSQNQLAEVFFRTLALEKTGVGTPDSARAVVERQLAAWGIPREAHAVRDGSGLSRHDYITPRAIVRVLHVTRAAPYFPVFYESLPIAGQDGTLRSRMVGVAPGRVHAKTGTIDKARALSGYVTTADGEMLIFSMIANNYTVPNREIERIQDLIVTRLTALQRRTP